MTDTADFQDIRVFIPGYSIEDLSSDLDEDEATSLLNAFAVAWHPLILKQSGSLPDVYQAESNELPTEKHLIFIPQCSESWLGPDWQLTLEETESEVFHNCQHRPEWLEQIESRLGADLPQCDVDLRDDFLALGTAWLQVRLMSRRMHFYVDPDQQTLEQATFQAANAAVAGNVKEAKKYLQTAFECLLDCREQFYPVECCLVDLCLPNEQSTADEIQSLLSSSDKLTLLTDVHQIAQFVNSKPSLEVEFQEAAADNRLSLLTGHFQELRNSLSSLSGFVSDVSRGTRELKTLSPEMPLHWARKRFGLFSDVPTALSIFGFESALHVALDDGVYPDNERGQIQWRGLDGTTMFASSRLPMAIDGAASFQKFADRYSESMQEDTTAVAILARLPTVHSPWLNDLKRTATYAPVFGQFMTWNEYCQETQSRDDPESFHAGDYLSPSLIQSSVLKTEAPISSPASILKLRCQLDGLKFVSCQLALLSSEYGDQPDEIERLEQRLNAEEAVRLNPDMPSSSIAAPESDPITATAEQQAQRLTDLKNEASELGSSLLSRYADLLPSADVQQRGKLLVNPFATTTQTTIEWPSDWNLPAAADSITESWKQKTSTFLNVKVPPGGFAWLHEAGSSSVIKPQKSSGKPLAEPWLLRNRFFEVHLSDKTGGIAGVYFHGQRANRISQQMAVRLDLSSATYSPNRTDADHYRTARCTGATLLASGPWIGTIETEGLIRQPGTKSKLIGYRQKISVERNRPIIDIEIELDADCHALEGNPWNSYLACRFAWDSETATLTRSQLGWPVRTKMDRFEAPQFIKVVDDDQIVQILTDGSPFHRKVGYRMLDSLIRVEGETASTFRFRLVLQDSKTTQNTIIQKDTSALQAAYEFMQPVLQHDTNGKIPGDVSHGWILGVSSRNVVVARSEVTPERRIRLLLQETEGRPANCKIRLAKQAKKVSQILDNGAQITELGTDSDEFPLQMTRFQLKLIEISF